MIPRDELVRELDALLDLRSILDDSNNGLQVEGRGEVRTLAFALDACQATIEQANAKGADMLIVHHGLFWGQVLMVRGAHASRLRACLAGGLSLYAAHLPLDAHPVLGNNASLLEDAGFSISPDRFAEIRGFKIGYLGEHAEGRTVDEITASLEGALFCRPARILGKYDGRKFKRAAAISGGALRYAEDAARAGAELYITGEGSHSAYHAVLESGIVTLLYGHYASEMIGIRRLREYCRKTFGLECVLIDAPTGW